MQKSIVTPASLGGLALYEYTPISDLSQETTAFSGTVYDLGEQKRIGTLINDGHGGCHVFHGDSLEAHKRWNEACREFTPVSWSGDEDDGGEWGLDEALVLLSESALTLLEECKTGEQKFFAADPRTVVDSESITVVTATTRPGKVSATALFRLASECHDDYGTVVFGARCMSKPGGVNVFVTESIDIDGERSPSRTEEGSVVC